MKSSFEVCFCVSLTWPYQIILKCVLTFWYFKILHAHLLLSISTLNLGTLVPLSRGWY